MALDVQRNWDVSMAENLQRTLGRSKHEKMATDGSKPDEEAHIPSSSIRSENPIHLPDEIIHQILDYVQHLPRAQETLASCCHLSRQWYAVAVPLLYRAPNLIGHRYEPFVHAICPSINQHVRKSPLSSLVKILDMRRLVHQGSKSMTARLLGRTKGSLEEFCAPQASFAINCLPALSKCSRLRTLDLTLVSESPPLLELLRTTSHLVSLRTLRLPRSSGFGVHTKPAAFASISWPPNLEDLCLSGGIDAHFLHGIVALPQTIQSLTIEHCPNAKAHAVVHLLRTAVKPLPKLETLKIAHMPRLSGRALDSVLVLLPQLKKLSVSSDYVTDGLLDKGDIFASGDSEDANLDPVTVAQPETPVSFIHENLRMLELTYSGATLDVDGKLSALDIMIAIQDGVLPQLRQVRLDHALQWHGAATREDVELLTELLQERAKQDWEDNHENQDSLDIPRWEIGSGVWVIPP